MKNIKVLILILSILLLAAGCGEREAVTTEPAPTEPPCEHAWVDADHEGARFCGVCGAIEGEGLPENFRFVEYTSEDGEVTVKFAGTFDERDNIIKGVAVYPDYTALIGQTEEGLGNYSISYENGDIYRGYMNKVFRHGTGIMLYINGDKYEGSFENDVISNENTPDAECVYTYADGTVYVGDFANGKIHGEGVATYADGSTYEGSFVGGSREGKGSYTFANGDMYTGEYVAGKMEGKGVYVFANGDMYSGEYKANLREGNGTYVFANGDKYEGQFSDGQMHGEGTYTLSDGRSYSGRFENGLIVQDGTGDFIDINKVQ